ncbi:aminotransferase class III-fold pyridoxal phosphate-dependent enzyme [Microterricola pindariensis]|uniref:Glutamate-1-semialdehyde 2,1-aminomutase n=1 Tax=Microterricola pindariensis TaxID=478010 RepID=A0ABX5AWD7_9MICO|nr:aminotransferase class III-fold pyridoxal phosphate-dependent enzyme [Microterricola pindariensis]PPL19200.1 glutamate-1-semialdehyde 2,1-aminomutase [Microterricola pindariensis]
MTKRNENTTDASLRSRAEKVLPGGVYGHMNMKKLPSGYPQFMETGDGARITDVDGNEYIDFMCGWGPIVLGRQFEKVDESARAVFAKGDIFNGPGVEMVELAELMCETIPHADWALFGKNGTDATTACVTTARAATGRNTILIAVDAYHGAIPWCTPRLSGVTPEDRAHQVRFVFNDVESLKAAVAEAGDDFAAIIIAPVHQPLGLTQEYATAEFAQAARQLCDDNGALLILDEVRVGFRIDLKGSWDQFGVQPDLAAWSKAIANGYPLSAVTGTERLRESATSIYVTGSFWYSASSMAAAIATITQLRDTDALEQMRRVGTLLCAGLSAQAAKHGIDAQVSGPVQMPLLLFGGPGGVKLGELFAQFCIDNGVYLHPTHNWFVSAAHSESDIEKSLTVTDAAFASLNAAIERQDAMAAV